MSEDNQINKVNEKINTKPSISPAKKKGAIALVCGALLFGGASAIDSVGKKKLDKALSEINNDELNIQVDSVDVGILGGITLEDVSVKQGIGGEQVSYTIDSVELSHRNFKDEIPNDFEFSVNSLVAEIPEEFVDHKLLSMLNLEEGVEIDYSGGYDIGLMGGIDANLTQSINNIGEFDVEFSGDNWSQLLDAANKLLKSKSSGSNEAIQLAQSKLMESSSDASIQNFSLSFENDGIAELVIKNLSAEQGVSEEQFKSQVNMMIDQMYGFVAGGMSQTSEKQHEKIKKSLKSFIDSPDELNLDIDFGEGVTVEELMSNAALSARSNAALSAMSKASVSLSN